MADDEKFVRYVEGASKDFKIHLLIVVVVLVVAVTITQISAAPGWVVWSSQLIVSLGGVFGYEAWRYHHPWKKKGDPDGQ